MYAVTSASAASIRSERNAVPTRATRGHVLAASVVSPSPSPSARSPCHPRTRSVSTSLLLLLCTPRPTARDGSRRVGRGSRPRELPGSLLHPPRGASLRRRSQHDARIEVDLASHATAGNLGTGAGANDSVEPLARGVRDRHE